MTWYGADRGLDPRYHSFGGHFRGERASIGARASRSGPRALASGPVATVLQDILSVAIYLSIATMVLHW